jgi:hypothetical protein
LVPGFVKPTVMVLSAGGRLRGLPWGIREIRDRRGIGGQAACRPASAVVPVATCLTSRNTRVCPGMITKPFSCYRHQMSSCKKCFRDHGLTRAFEKGEDVFSGARLTRVTADARPRRPAPPHVPIARIASQPKPCHRLYSSRNPGQIAVYRKSGPGLEPIAALLPSNYLPGATSFTCSPSTAGSVP